MALATNPQTCSPPLSLQALQAENRRLLARNEHLLPLAQEAVWRRKLDAVPQKQLSASGKIILARIRRTINGRKEPTPLFFPEIAKDIGMSEDTIGSVIKNQLAPAGALLRTQRRDPDTKHLRILVAPGPTLNDPDALVHDQAACWAMR